MEEERRKIWQRWCCVCSKTFFATGYYCFAIQNNTIIHKSYPSCHSWPFWKSLVVCVGFVGTYRYCRQALQVRRAQNLNLVVQEPDVSHRFVKHWCSICLQQEPNFQFPENIYQNVKLLYNNFIILFNQIHFCNQKQRKKTIWVKLGFGIWPCQRVIQVVAELQFVLQASLSSIMMQKNSNPFGKILPEKTESIACKECEWGRDRGACNGAD